MRHRNSKQTVRQDSAGERLQKVLARAGVGSRRHVETLIEDGRVELNGKPAQLGDRYKYGDRLKVNGKLVNQSLLAEKRAKVMIYHKPVGELCTHSDPEGRPTIFDSLPRIHNGRWITVGRLDINTSGLLIITTDGALANSLMHPSSEIEREYAVRVLGEVNMDIINNLRNGVELEDGPAKFDEILDSGGSGSNHWYHVMLKEGRNREVRRLWESQGVTVSRLIRIRYGSISLPKGLRAGKWRELTDVEVRSLRKLIKQKKGASDEDK